MQYNWKYIAKQINLDLKDHQPTSIIFRVHAFSTNCNVAWFVVPLFFATPQSLDLRSLRLALSAIGIIAISLVTIAAYMIRNP